jgi:hypothetical protein
MTGVEGDGGDELEGGSCSSSPCKESIAVGGATSVSGLISPVCDVESTAEPFSSSEGGFC